MAIKRISELDLFSDSDLSNFLSTDTTKTIHYDSVYDFEKLSVGLWFETSTPLSGFQYTGGNRGHWGVIPVNEAPSYYISKKINGTILANLLTWDLRNSLSNIINGPINYYGSQNFGDPTASFIDVTGHTVWYDDRPFVSTEDNPDNPNRLCVMVSADFTNETIFHNKVEFHSPISFKGLYGDVTFHTVTSSYVWNNQTINPQGPWVEFDKDIVVDGTAYIDVLKAGDIYVDNVIHGACLCAYWADLAENYESDQIYPRGTLVEFGGEKEITIARNYANAVVTSSPGLVLNGSRNGLGIALVGRVPVRIIGKVKKFDKITLSEIPGVGMVSSFGHIGLALESSDDEDEKLIECVVQLLL